MKAAIALSFCIVAVFSATVPTTPSMEEPEECSAGKSTYNETLCAETCTKDFHKMRPYCSNLDLTSIDKGVTRSVEDAEATSVVTVSNQTSKAPTTEPPKTTKHPNSGINLKSSLTFTGFSLLLSYVFL